MPRSVVIGGNGFLGSYLVDELVARGHEVTAFDRFSAGTESYSSGGVRRLEGDYLDRESLREAVSGQDHVFHFLSTSTPATAEDDPSGDVRGNVATSVDLLALAVEAGVRRVDFASSGGAMYGNVVGDRIAEDAAPAPVSPYAISKLAIEGYLRYFERKHGLESVAWRISNPYGPRQHPARKQGVIPIFLQRIADGLPIEVYGDGSAVRDYIYAQDVARMIASTADDATRQSVYNVGSGVGASIAQIVALAGEITGRDVLVNHLSQPSTFVDRVVLDTRRFDEEFGRPELVGLRDGIERTWADTRESAS